MINDLVEDVSRSGVYPSATLRMHAAHVAAMRVVSFSMKEADLRAVVHDVLFPFSGASSPKGAAMIRIVSSDGAQIH